MNHGRRFSNIAAVMRAVRQREQDLEDTNVDWDEFKSRGELSGNVSSPVGLNIRLAGRVAITIRPLAPVLPHRCRLGGNLQSAHHHWTC